MKFGGAVSVVALSIVISTGSLIGAPAGASVPRGGVVKVTAYGRLTFSTKHVKAVTVTAKNQKAAAIRSALSGLSPAEKGTKLNCVLNSTLYTIRFSRSARSVPTYVATWHECPSPGTLTITENGKSLRPVQPDCSLQRALLATLPARSIPALQSEIPNC
jgi:hypothetical protein